MYSKRVFLLRALAGHSLLIVPLYFYPETKEFLHAEAPKAILFYLSGLSLFAASIFFIFFNVDHLFISYSMHKYRHGIVDNSKAMTKLFFFVWKLFIWSFTLFVPIAFVLWSQNLPGGIAFYIGIFLLGFFLINFQFLFASFQKYQEKWRAGRWGLGGVRFKQA